MGKFLHENPVEWVVFIQERNFFLLWRSCFTPHNLFESEINEQCMKATGRIFLGIGILSAAVAVASWRKSQQNRYNSGMLSRVNAYRNDPTASMYHDEDSDLHDQVTIKGFFERLGQKGEALVNRLQSRLTNH